MAYYNLDPFGEERADLRMSIMASSIVNTILATSLGKKAKRYFLKFKDLLPKFGTKKKKDPVDMLAKMKKFSQLYGGKLIIGDEDGDDTIDPSS